MRHSSRRVRTGDIYTVKFQACQGWIHILCSHLSHTSMLHLPWSFSWSELAEQQNHGKTIFWKRELVGTEFLLGLWAYVFNSGSHGQKMAFLSTPPPRLRKSKGGVHNEERSINTQSFPFIYKAVKQILVWTHAQYAIIFPMVFPPPKYNFGCGHIFGLSFIHVNIWR